MAYDKWLYVDDIVVNLDFVEKIEIKWDILKCGNFICIIKFSLASSGPDSLVEWYIHLDESDSWDKKEEREIRQVILEEKGMYRLRDYLVSKKFIVIPEEAP